MALFSVFLLLILEQPLKSANLAEVVPEWDANFVEIEQELLFELILVRARFADTNRAHTLNQAANYMDIKSLLDLTCAKIASMIKGEHAAQV